MNLKKENNYEFNKTKKIHYSNLLKDYLEIISKRRKKMREERYISTNEEKFILLSSFSFKNVCKFITNRIYFSKCNDKLMLNQSFSKKN